MSYLLWHEHAPSLASPRRLFAAHELPEFESLQALRERLLELAREQELRCQQAHADAQALGLAQGLQQGRQAALAAVQQEWAAALQAWERSRQQALHSRREDVALLALQVARKLIGQLPEAEQLARLAQEAARSLLPEAAPVLLRVHPAHEQGLRELLAPSLASGQMQLLADAALPQEACRLSSALGEADAALATQLARIAASWGLGVAVDIEVQP
jgi:flagellar biosynthesis/type III secretory pathway protein FliH